jgi:hypothetical protein
MATKKTKNQKLKERTQKAKMIAAGQNPNPAVNTQQKGFKNLFGRKKG